MQLTLALLRLGVLALLWIFVLMAARVIRTDLFATSGGSRTTRRDRRRAAPSPQQRSMARKLVVTSGSLIGASVPLDATPVTIGRANGCTLVLDDEYVSNQHARLSPDSGAWLVEDLGSTNGTFLGNQRVAHPTPVPLGTPIRIGTTTLELRK